MKTKLRHLIVIGTLFFTAQAQAAGLLSPRDGSLPALKIKQHHVKVIIEDAYAITEVTQVFYNPHAQDLEAIYSFPVPEKASVAEFTMWIDGKPISGEVLEKQQAKQIYEEEKRAGREAGLTEKDSFKTFDISVYPVRAQQDMKIRLVYFQPAHVDTGIGRYVYPLEEGGVDEEKLAFWTANEKVEEHFSFDLKIRSAYPVEAVRVPKVQAQIQKITPAEWKVNFANQTSEEGKSIPGKPAQAFSLNQDIVVYWRHQEGLPGSVDLIAYKPESKKRGTFMLVVTPGEDLQPISEGKDWVFVLDISGSMQGKYATLAQGVERVLKKLRPNDRFRIILFNNRSQELTQGYVNASAANVAEYIQKVSAVNPNGGTNLYAGVSQGIDALDADRTSGIILVTDGVANVGETQQRSFLNLLKKKDVRLFTAIMGNSANRPMLQTLTKASGGFAVSVSNSDDIVGKVLEMTSKLSHEALHGVKLKIKGVKVRDLTPANIGSLYRGQQLVMFGHYWGDGLAEVSLSGKISGQNKQYATQFHFPATALENPEIERLWAYDKIQDLSEEIRNFGEKADIKQAIADLGKEYSLVTDYTSMIVLREEIFTQRGIKRLNKQRLQIEQRAQQARAQAPVKSRRVDSSSPMYQGRRPIFGGGGGGGAIGPWLALLLLPLLYYRRKR